MEDVSIMKRSTSPCLFAYSHTPADVKHSDMTSLVNSENIKSTQTCQYVLQMLKFLQSSSNNKNLKKKKKKPMQLGKTTISWPEGWNKIQKAYMQCFGSILATVLSVNSYSGDKWYFQKWENSPLGKGKA